MSSTKLDEELKQLSIYVYQNGSGKIPDGWEVIRTDSNDNTGYYAEVYKKGSEIAVVYRGTELTSPKDVVIGDIPMGANFPSGQLKDAEKTYSDIAKDYSSNRIVLTGHSLGGSLAQVVSAETGRKAVTYNAYGTGEILKDLGYKDTRFMDITNYGNPNDPIFMKNKDNQPGTTYVTNTNLNPKGEISYGKPEIGYGDLRNHPAEKMDSLDKAVKVTEKDSQPSKLEKIKDKIFKKDKQDKVETADGGGTSSKTNKSGKEGTDTGASPMTIEGGVSYDHYQQKADTLAQLKQPQESRLKRFKDNLFRKGKNNENKDSKAKDKGKGKGTGANGWKTINGAHIFFGA